MSPLTRGPDNPLPMRPSGGRCWLCDIRISEDERIDNGDLCDGCSS